MNAIDLFAGPGGWDLAASRLGIEPLGLENDRSACLTRDAAGLTTLSGDVAAHDPARTAFGLGREPLDLLIASPPCQAWSMAGKREGQKDIESVYALTRDIAYGDEPGEYEWADERSSLVTEPLRWALALKPRFIACEQVPPVLNYWRFVADLLREFGYGTWTGIIEAERYGVPQTRERAILMAVRGGAPAPPTPTHQRYVPGEPARHDVTLEGEILPWVSMAEALGWGMTERPYPVVASGRETGGPDKEKVGGSSAREAIYSEQREGRWLRSNARSNATERAETEPAPTITGGHDAAERRWLRAGTAENDASRPEDEPAPTIRFGERLNTVAWHRERDLSPCGCEWDNVDEGGFCACCQAHIDDPDGFYALQGDGTHNLPDCPSRSQPSASWTADRPAPTITGTRRSDEGGIVGRQLPKGEGRNVGGRNWREDSPPTHYDTRQSHAQPQPVEEPAPTMRSAGLAKGVDAWTNEERETAAERDAKGYKPAQEAVRVTIEEASILQGFPSDYPWQGSRTKQFQQIGNAVPPPMAEAILSALVGVAAEVREAA